MEEWLKRHPLLSTIGGVIGMIVATLAAVDVIWSLISNEPLLPYISTKAPRGVQIVLAILFVALCIFCIVIVRKVHRQTKKSPRPKIKEGELTDMLEKLKIQEVLKMYRQKMRI